MVASFYRQLDTSPDVEAKNESHLNFINVLEEAFEILGGSKWREQAAATRAARKTQSTAVPSDEGDGSALHMSNRFAELEVEDKDLGMDEEAEEEPTPKVEGNEWIAGLVNKPGSAKSSKKAKPKKFALASYKIREDLSEGEELSFAVWCFFVDMNSIRQYLKAVWNQVRKGNIDLMTASVVSSVAVRMVDQLEATLSLSFPKIQEYPDLLRALLTELPIDKVKKLLDLLDFCLFFPVHTLCSYRHDMFSYIPGLASRDLKEIKAIATQCGLNGRVVKTSIAHADKISSDAAFLEQYLMRLTLATEWADRVKLPSDPRIGMSAFHMHFERFLHMGEMKTRLVFSVQIMIDIHNAIVPKDRTKYQRSAAKKFVKSAQAELSREIRLIEHRGPSSTKNMLTQFSSWCDNWLLFGKMDPKDAENLYFPNLSDHLLTDNPWHLGLVYAEVSYQLFNFASYHSALSLPTVLHLYNFLIQVESIIPGSKNLKRIPILELLCEAFIQHCFQGSRPTSNFANRFALSSRKDLTAFASDAHRRNRPADRNTFSYKHLEKLALPHTMTALHSVMAGMYRLEGSAYSMIDKIVQSQGPTSTTHNSASAAATTSPLSTSADSKKGNKREKEYVQSLSPAQLLDKLCNALWLEHNGPMPIGRVDMLRFRGVCLMIQGLIWKAVQGEFLETRSLGYRDKLKDNVMIDMTPGILELERHAHSVEVRRRIVGNAKKVFEKVFEGKTLEDYFSAMPTARRKPWREWEKGIVGEGAGSGEDVNMADTK